MKATLTYNLEDEKVAFEQALSGGDYYMALSEFKTYIETKYENKYYPNDQCLREYEEIKNEFQRILTSCQINLKEI